MSRRHKACRSLHSTGKKQYQRGRSRISYEGPGGVDIFRIYMLYTYEFMSQHSVCSGMGLLLLTVPSDTPSETPVTDTTAAP